MQLLAAKLPSDAATSRASLLKTKIEEMLSLVFEKQFPDDQTVSMKVTALRAKLGQLSQQQWRLLQIAPTVNIALDKVLLPKSPAAGVPKVIYPDEVLDSFSALIDAALKDLTLLHSERILTEEAVEFLSEPEPLWEQNPVTFTDRIWLVGRALLMRWLDPGVGKEERKETLRPLIRVFCQEFVTKRHNFEQFLDYLGVRGTPTGNDDSAIFRRELRSRIANVGKLSERQVIFIPKQESFLFWLLVGEGYQTARKSELIGDRKEVGEVMTELMKLGIDYIFKRTINSKEELHTAIQSFIEEHVSGQPNAAVVSSEEQMRVAQTPTAGVHVVFKDKTGKRTPLLFIGTNLGDFELLRAGAHEAGHNQQSDEALKLNMEEFGRTLAEGFQACREFAIIRTWAGEKTAFAEQARMLVEREYLADTQADASAVSLFNETKAQLETYALEDWEIHLWLLLTTYRENYFSEQYFLESILPELDIPNLFQAGFTGPLLPLYFNGDVRPFREVLGSVRFDALRDLFNTLRWQGLSTSQLTAHTIVQSLGQVLVIKMLKDGPDIQGRKERVHEFVLTLDQALWNERQRSKESSSAAPAVAPLTAAPAPLPTQLPGSGAWNSI